MRILAAAALALLLASCRWGSAGDEARMLQARDSYRPPRPTLDEVAWVDDDSISLNTFMDARARLPHLKNDVILDIVIAYALAAPLADRPKPLPQGKPSPELLNAIRYAYGDESKELLGGLPPHPDRTALRQAVDTLTARAKIQKNTELVSKIQ